MHITIKIRPQYADDFLIILQYMVSNITLYITLTIISQY